MSTYSEVKSGDALADSEVEALRLYDEGKSDADIAEALGYAVGAAGNVRRMALRKVGRENEIGGARRKSGTSATKATVKVSESFADQVRHQVEQLNAEIDDLTTRQAELTSSVEMSDEDIFNAEVARLTDVVTRAQAALDAFEASDDDTTNAFIQRHREAAEARLNSQNDAISAALLQAGSNLNAANTALAAIEALEVKVEDTSDDEKVDESEASDASKAKTSRKRS